MTSASACARLETMALALAANIVSVWLGYRARVVSRSGAIGGAFGREAV